MTLSMLSCFMEAMDTLNFTTAAQNIHITQPAFSRNIAALEEKLGFPLFIRSKQNGLKATPAAEEYYQGLKKLEAEYDLLMQRAGRISRGEEGKLAVGIQIGMCVDSWIKHCIQSMAERYPQVEIQLICYPLRELIKSVEDGKTDTCIIINSAITSNENLCSEDIVEVENYLAVPSRLGCDCNCAHDLSEFSEETFIISEDMPDLNERLFGVCRSAGFVPKTRMAPDFETKMLWIEFGQGVGVNSKEHYIKNSPHVDFVKVKQIGMENYAMIWQEGNTNPTLNLFREFFKEQRN